MDRRAKPKKGKAEAKPPLARKSPGHAVADVSDLETRLAQTLGQLQTRDRELAEALEQQTATSEILRIIASSPTDLQPVLDALAESAARLCRSVDCGIFLLHGDHLVLRARHGPSHEVVGQFALSLNRGTVGGRSVLEQRTIHVIDLLAEAGEFPEAQRNAEKFGFRTMLSVPLIRETAALGVIQLRRTEVNPFTDRQAELLKTFADQAVIAIENVRLFKELEARNRDLTATSEILQVMSTSTTDAQPVFQTIVEAAVRLSGALFGSVYTFDGELMYMVAQHNYPAAALQFSERTFPAPLTRKLFTGRAILERTVVHVADVSRDEERASVQEFAEQVGFRSVLSVPMLREGNPVGAITVWRSDAGPFADSHIALLQTFADQAVIAIENVRLFRELQEKNQALTKAHAQVTESLEQQTATSEILGVISSSPTDIQPVFDTIVERAGRLCDAAFGGLHRFDGEWITLDAHYNVPPEELAHLERYVFPFRAGRRSATGRAVLDRAVVHVHDVLADPEYRLATPITYRTVLSVPMLRGEQPIGAVTLWRREVRPFSDRQIKLVTTFADQAVIAIENVRLFKELQEKNQTLTKAHAQVSEALDRQIATADILRVISRSQADVQPVFDTIVDNAMRLFRAWAAAIFQSDGKLLHLIAARGGPPGSEQHLREQFPRPIDGTFPAGRCVADRTIVHIPDAESDPTVDPALQRLARTRGYRSVLGAPMIREGQPIGAITVTRTKAGSFSPADIELLQTFAAQAVIAIENARLLTELRERTQELTRSVEHLTALGEVGRAVSSTLDLETVLTTIVSRAVQLTGVDGGVVFEYDEVAEEFELRASTGQEALGEVRRRARFRKGEGVVGRTAIAHEPVQVADITRAGTYVGRLRESLIEGGVRALLAIPMLREGHLIGSLVVNRNTPGDFPPETVDLLRTFATQSALAIQNARLFQEVEDKGRELEAASRHKSEFLANMSHELRTPLNAIIGFSEVLSERMFGELNEKQEEYLQDIHASGQHLLSLINDILDLSKIEAGRMELELSDFHLPTAIDNALVLIRERAGRRGIRLGSTLAESVGTIRADERKVKQVLLNLLSNAIKFTPEGGRIEVRARLAEGGVELSVSDTGVGIAPEDQGAVFEEFRQVGTADKKVEGTGLGLALSRKFIELHGGRIWVKSQVGQGSTFTFTLPV